DVRFRIGRIENVVLVNKQAAGLAELLPFFQELPFLIEYLDPIVSAVPDKQPALGIESHGMRAVEFALPLAGGPPGFYELPVPVELHNAVVGGRAVMTVGDEDVPVGSDCQSGWLAEMRIVRPVDARDKEVHQNLAFRTEL